MVLRRWESKAGNLVLTTKLKDFEPLIMAVSGDYGGQTCFELVRNFIKFFAVSFVLCQLILSQALEECSSALRG